jgi:hypothetical protein
MMKQGAEGNSVPGPFLNTPMTRDCVRRSAYKAIRHRARRSTRFDRAIYRRNHSDPAGSIDPAKLETTTYGGRQTIVFVWRARTQSQTLPISPKQLIM